MKNKIALLLATGLLAIGVLSTALYAPPAEVETPTRYRLMGLVGRDGNQVDPASDYVLAGAYAVKFPVGVSYILADPNVGGPVLWPADLVRIGLVMEATDANVRFAMNATASATSPQWPQGGVASLPIKMADANSLRFIGLDGATAKGTLFTYKPR